MGLFDQILGIQFRLPMLPRVHLPSGLLYNPQTVRMGMKEVGVERVSLRVKVLMWGLSGRWFSMTRILRDLEGLPEKREGNGNF